MNKRPADASCLGGRPRRRHSGRVQTESPTPRELLTSRVAESIRAGASSAEILDLIIRDGWQPGPDRDPNSDYFEGILDSGRRVPIEVHHGRH